MEKSAKLFNANDLADCYDGIYNLVQMKTSKRLLTRRKDCRLEKFILM